MEEARRIVASGKADGLLFKTSDLDAACKLTAEAAARPYSATSPHSPEGKALAAAGARGTVLQSPHRIGSGMQYDSRPNYFPEEQPIKTARDSVQQSIHRLAA